jgi:putative transposase
VWQLNLTTFETTREGRWQIAGCTDYVAKYKFERWVAPTQIRYDAIGAAKAAITDAEQVLGRPLLEDITDEIHPVVGVTDIQTWWRGLGPRVVRPAA